MPQRYKEFLIYANKWRFFYEKYRIVSDDNEQSPPPSGHCGKRTKTTDAGAKGPHAEGGQARTKPPMSEPQTEAGNQIALQKKKEKLRAITRSRKRTKKKKIPLLYGREGDRDVQIVFGRNGRKLFFAGTFAGEALVAKAGESSAYKRSYDEEPELRKS